MARYTQGIRIGRRPRRAPVRRERTPVRRVAQRIPRGLISDLLDVYDVETLIVQDFFRDISHPSPELNYQYREFLNVIDALIAKTHVSPRSNDANDTESFYIPFDDLYSAEKEFQTQGKILNDKKTVEAVIIEMHATRRRIKDILHSKLVTNETVNDKVIQKMIANAKLLLGVHQSAPRFEVHVDRKLGIHCYIDGKDTYYPKVRPANQIFRTLLYLVERGEPVGIARLATNTAQEAKSIKRSIKDFNENFKRVFNAKAKPITTTGTGLYYANVNDFKFL